MLITYPSSVPSFPVFYFKLPSPLCGLSAAWKILPPMLLVHISLWGFCFRLYALALLEQILRGKSEENVKVVL
jgi:hypothetical protein